tara:strand:- start:452 stop:724 length:273 start_codon:yes stop_codon:yes gene_type:complete
MNREKEIIHLFSKRIPVDLIYLILDKEKEMIHKEGKKYWERISPVYLYSIFTQKHHEHIIYQRDKKRLEHIRKINGSLKTLKSSNLYIEM